MYIYYLDVVNVECVPQLSVSHQMFEYWYWTYKVNQSFFNRPFRPGAKGIGHWAAGGRQVMLDFGSGAVLLRPLAIPVNIFLLCECLPV